MKYKLNVQTKLLLGFISILFVTIVIVSVTSHYWLAKEIGHFFDGNDFKPEMFGPPDENPLLRDMRNLFTLIAIVGAVLASVMSFVFARYLVMPIKRVIETTQKIAKGKYKERVKVTSKDEIGDLCEAVNKMAFELEEMEKLRRELVSNVAHELATPLTNISGYLEAIHDGTIKGQKLTEETLVLLRDETDRLAGMVNDVRALSVVENPNMKLSMVRFDLEVLAKSVVVKMKPNFKAKGVEVKVLMSKDLPKAFGDKSKFVQILMNLLANAILYTPKGGKVSVSAKKDGKCLCLIVKDTGVGISKKDLPHIFERFYRVDKSRSRKTGGTGVGLTIVKDLVEAHGGEIEVESKVGKGSKFTCKFPHTKTSRATWD